MKRVFFDDELVQNGFDGVFIKINPLDCSVLGASAGCSILYFFLEGYEREVPQSWTNYIKDNPLPTGD